MTSSEQSNDVSQTETEITSDSNIIPYSQYLSETQQETESKPKLYDGNVILKMDTVVIPDSDETLMLCEESRSNMLLKEQDPLVAVEQHRLESRTFKVKINQVLSENERLLAQAITEAEYIALSGCCAQVLWMRSQLIDNVL
ncbi:hypothetical protein Tco_0443487 [Tanacetum coccineum]